MKLDLKPLCQRIADRLGIDPLVIKFEEMIDDSKLYIKEEYVAINKKYENDYEECAKSIAHEYRHVFQIFYVSMFSNERSKRWKKELQDVVNSSYKNANFDTKNIKVFVLNRLVLEKNRLK